MTMTDGTVKRPTKRIDWLSVMRGATIVLVVMFHVQLVDMSTGACHEECHQLTKFFDPVRMPLFIFSSGGLLYLSRISKGWTTGRLYYDKLLRIGVPFVFFVIVYYVLKLAMQPFVKTPAAVSFSSFVRSFYIFDGTPSAPLWFLATLTVLMMLYPFYRMLLRSHWCAAVSYLAALAFYFVDLTSLLPENYFNVLRLNRYFLYFLSGILFFRYKCYELTGHWLCAVLSVAAYAVMYANGAWPVALSVTGIVMMVAVCQQTARFMPGLFSSFRDYIYQIYLLSMFFQGFVELVLWQRLCYDENLFWLFYVLNVCAGIFGPLLVVRLVERCPWRGVQLCFGLS